MPPKFQNIFICLDMHVNEKIDFHVPEKVEYKEREDFKVFGFLASFFVLSLLPFKALQLKWFPNRYKTSTRSKFHQQILSFFLKISRKIKSSSYGKKKTLSLIRIYTAVYLCWCHVVSKRVLG